MTSPRIALFADQGSLQILEIRDAVAAEGGRPLVLDLQLGGRSAPDATVDPSRLRWDGADFTGIQALHIRCTALNTLPSLPPVMNRAMYAETQALYLREQEYQAVAYSFFEEFAARGGLVVNPLTGGFIDHDTKTQFYEKLRAHGFHIPASLTTNSPEQASAFIQAHGETVLKPAVGVGSTRLITGPELQDLDRIVYCPVLLQERVRGDTLRVHVVGDRVVMPLRIISEGLDSRTETRGFEPISMSEREEERIVAAHRLLGLHYSAWDVIASEDGRYVYLDANSGPYVMWIGPKYRTHVFRQLARYLVVFARTGDLRKASEAVEAWKP